jgi:hypothetical protein
MSVTDMHWKFPCKEAPINMRLRYPERGATYDLSAAVGLLTS